MSDYLNRTHVACSCAHNLHFIDFDVTEWEPGDTVISVFVSAGRTTLWRRLKAATAYVFGTTDDLVMGDVVLTPQKAHEIVTLLSPYSEPSQ